MITNEDAAQKVDELYHSTNDFSNWEEDFLGDMYARTEFTDRELEKIEELWKEHYQ